MQMYNKWIKMPIILADKSLQSRNTSLSLVDRVCQVSVDVRARGVADTRQSFYHNYGMHNGLERREASRVHCNMQEGQRQAGEPPLYPALPSARMPVCRWASLATQAFHNEFIVIAGIRVDLHFVCLYLCSLTV